jgi:hypothetical protein
MSNVHKPATWPLHRPAGVPTPAADATPDAPPPLGPQSVRKSEEPLLKRPAAEARSDLNPPSLESIIAAVSVGQPTHHRGPAGWRKPQFMVVGLALLAVVAPISVGIAVVMLSSGLPPLGRRDQTAPLLAPSAAPTVSAADANRRPSERAPAQIEERAASTGSEHDEDRSAPPAAAQRDPAASAAANSRGAAIEPEKATPAPEVGRQEPRHEATSPEAARPATSPPPPATTSSSPVRAVTAATPAPAPVVSPDSKALAAANSRIAAVESERDALAAQVARLERQERVSAPPQVNPSPPSAAASPAPFPGAPSVGGSGLDLSAASASLPQGMPARVLIRYSGNGAEARQRAESLANALRDQGVEVADLRESAAAIRTELSFSYAPDEAIARQVGRLVGVTPVRRLQAKDALVARPGTVELNLSGDSHLAAIKPTSSRESNHE